MDVVKFCSDLIGHKSVTPCDDGAIDYIADFLKSIGFETEILTFTSEDNSNSVKNLFAKYGSSNKILGFLGHSDVVPAGNKWNTDPFVATEIEGFLFGRGVADMKGGIAAFCCAVEDFIQNSKKKEDCCIMFFITGDEEIGSKEGMQSLLDWCKKKNYIPTDCIIGEPSSSLKIGDRAYIGHRGSLNAIAKYEGKQGHTAYPGSFDNSLTPICKFVKHMLKYNWKHNDETYPKTSIEPTMLFTNNYAENVVPDTSSVNFNVRFGSDYHAEDIIRVIREEANKYRISVDVKVSGNAYMCDNAKLKSLLSEAIKEVTGLTPEFSAAGGISDGRYLVSLCNFIEFGLQDALIHQKNERVRTDDLRILQRIYRIFIENYFDQLISYRSPSLKRR